MAAAEWGIAFKQSQEFCQTAVSGKPLWVELGVTKETWIVICDCLKFTILVRSDKIELGILLKPGGKLHFGLSIKVIA